MKKVTFLLFLGLLAGCGDSPNNQLDQSNAPAETHTETSAASPVADSSASVDADALIEEAIADMDKKRVSSGIAKLERAVAMKSPKAMRLLGAIYLGVGDVTEPDRGKGFLLMKNAAEMDDPEAMAMLAVCYQEGLGTTADEEKSKYWRRRAVSAGYAPAILAFAEASYDKALREKFFGRKHQESPPTEVERRLVKEVLMALEKMKATDDDSVIRANLMLGAIYLNGVGVPSDVARGVSHYQECVSRGSKIAMSRLGIAYCEGENVAKDYAKGIPLLKRGIVAGKETLEECRALGNAYLDPEWDGFDLKVGIDWLEKGVRIAGDRGDRDYGIRDELYLLGRIYAFEERSLSLFRRGVEYLKRAKAEYMGEASYLLAVLYYNGDGVERNLFEASACASDAVRSSNVSRRTRDAAKRLEDAIKKERGY